MDSWKSSMSFTDRVTSISAIINAYKAAHPGATHEAASFHAHTTETRALKEANSLVEYHSRCKDAVSQLAFSSELRSNPAESAAELQSPDSVANQLLSNPKTFRNIGNFHKASLFKTGLLSQIYVAQVPDQGTPRDDDDRPHPGARLAVALKTIRLSAAHPPHDARREGRILSHLAGGSPNVILLIGSFYDAEGCFVLVLPFLPWTLATAIANKPGCNLNMRRALQDVCAALEYVHRKGVLHRDVKPSNVLLSSPDGSHGPAVLTDFGVAWRDGDATSEAADSKISDVGTGCYRAPEVLFGARNYGPSLDMWATGCVVAEVARGDGKALFDAGDEGSELTLVKSIMTSLGTPNEETWPETAKMPDWGKIRFHEYPPKSWVEILPNAPEEARNLVERLVRYSGGERYTARQALEHPFFKGCDNLED